MGTGCSAARHRRLTPRECEADGRGTEYLEEFSVLHHADSFRLKPKRRNGNIYATQRIFDVENVP
jgi:hypothetical protein